MIPKENVSDVISAVFDEAVDPRITVVGVGGAGGNPVGGAGGAAESAAAALRESLSSDIVFVVAGLGGAAGTGAGPVVAATAKGQGAVTIGIAILPFTLEGRDARAQGGLDRFRAEADSVIVGDNNSPAPPDGPPLREAFGLVNPMA